MGAKRIGVLGGAFDPIHYGHLLIAENAAEQYALDKVVFMPTGQPPHKEQQEMAGARDRLEMVRLAISDNPLFDVSSLEIDSEEVDYTYKTLEALKDRHPEDELYFILGGDSLRDFLTWRHPERILDSSCVLAAVRDDMEGDEFCQSMSEINGWYGRERVFRMRTPNVSVSSHEIRWRIGEGKTVRYMLPENVRAYIAEHGLYSDHPHEGNVRAYIAEHRLYGDHPHEGNARAYSAGHELHEREIGAVRHEPNRD